MPRARRWSDLPTIQQTAVGVGAAVEIALTATAAVDVLRRPRDQIHGPKPLWCLAIFVQPVGPIAYFTWGRRARA
ncbi:MAG: PLD nuclease N-terminal domain-containing protein [Jiangellaceae bacterium]